MSLDAAPRPLVQRRDRPWDGTIAACGVADVMRYVAVARTSLKGPLAVEIEGPGDPLASPETVLRALALLHEHHPEVLKGLVVDGPLMAEYVEDLAAFDVRWITVRLDAVEVATARRLVVGAFHRADRLARDEAAALVVDEAPRAIALARRHGIDVAVRTTLVPTVNAGEVEAIASRAFALGAARVDVVAHDPFPGAPGERAGIPTAAELADARAAVERARLASRATAPSQGALAWLAPDRLQAVDLDLLDAADVLGSLPDPHRDLEPAKVLPPRRAQLVAVTTRDGDLVDMALANAPLVRIYAVTGDAIRCLGARPLPLDPRRRGDGVGSAPAFLEAFVGCQALVTTHLTKRAATLLRAVGIQAVTRGGPVEDVLDRVARGTVPQAEVPQADAR